MYDQLMMFPDEQPDEPASDEDLSSVVQETGQQMLLSPYTLLEDAIDVYLGALENQGMSHHTVKAFRSDMNLLARWAGEDSTIGDFGTSDLNRFLYWMLNERDKPCSPKTYARRVTTLKNFFNYLLTLDVIKRDPAAGLIQKPVTSPLPEILYADEEERARAAAEVLRSQDARPLMLLLLLLYTGIKKNEAMALSPSDVIRSNPEQPMIWVRYPNPRMRYKERRIILPPEWLEVYDEYMIQRHPPEAIFDCTARNLEYVLRDVAHLAGLPLRKLSFETLRWTCALHEYLAGMPPDALREKLGLSHITWRETSRKLEQLSARYQQR